MVEVFVLAMMLDMELARFGGVVVGVKLVAMGQVGVVRAGQMVVLVVVLCRLAMMGGGHLVVLGGLPVVVGDIGTHGGILRSADRNVRAATLTDAP
jgi:hypothetical protein